MEVQIIKQSGVPVLRTEVDFYQVLEDNFDKIMDAIANRGIVLKELFELYKKNPKIYDELIQTVRHSRDTEDAVKTLRENLSMSKKTARYLLNMSLRDITSLSVDSLEDMLNNYKMWLKAIIID